jgi:tripartite-type tricarboxylate transporter receptor subunit TctC
MWRPAHLKKIVFIAVLTGITFGMWVVRGEAQVVYPAKPITIIVPFAAGGSTDLAVRGIAPYLGKYLKTTIVLENVPGADGVIGYNRVYSSKPDGYTLLASNTLPLILPEYSRETKYKTLEFKPIYAWARDSMILVVHPDFCKTFEEFVKIGRGQAIKIGTTGGATTTGLMGILFAEEMGIKVTWIPFGGGAESLTSLAGKHIDAVFSIAASALSLSKAGKLKPLAVFSEKRNSKYPDVPVPKELGSDIPLLFNHTGIVGPPGLPDDTAKKVEEAFSKSLETPEFLDWLNKVSTSDLVPLSSKEYRKEFERLVGVAEKYKKYLKQ